MNIFSKKKKRKKDFWTEKSGFLYKLNFKLMELGEGRDMKNDNLKFFALS